MPQTNLLYLPVVKLNDLEHKALIIPGNYGGTSAELALTMFGEDTLGTGIYLLPADNDTETFLNEELPGGILSNDGTWIKVHQGLDTSEISHTRPIGDLKETQYIVQVDNRFSIVTKGKESGTQASVSYIDDDQIASYYFSESQDDEYVKQLPINSPDKPPRIIKGPAGTRIIFSLYRSMEIETSVSLFNELGGSTMEIDGTFFYYIDTTVRVTGATTGSSIDIPIRVMKKQ